MAIIPYNHVLVRVDARGHHEGQQNRLEPGELTTGTVVTTPRL